ncbi:MAG: radical SAM protein [Paludibacteraceae bacterium]|nr:radical SAM protein [Paludibacteraceae bacterium]
MLFDSIVYGPIRSRRLGISLGINLMPTDKKLCTFNCIYCECGFNTPALYARIPTREKVREALESTLSSMDIQPDVITFSGNGEPTLHPKFAGIIEDIIALRDRYCPKAKVSVLSNSTQLGRESVREALMKCDNRILKLDSGIDSTMQLIDQPVNKDLTVARIVDMLSPFKGEFTLQTCFLRGEYKGQRIDNTSDAELEAWYRLVDRLHPQQLMIYVIDRATPVETLEKISREEMDRIAAPLIAKGYNVIVSA